MDQGAKEIFQDISYKSGLDIRIIQKIKTRNNRYNLLNDVDNIYKGYLLQNKRMCINFDRYGVVEFILITQYYKFQAFGHFASEF